MNQTIIAQQIYQAIIGAQNILVATHYAPDGDAAAALSAMAQILQRLGKKYTLFCADRFDDKLAWLPWLGQTVNREQDLPWAEFDLFITLDCGTLARSRLSGPIKARQTYQKLIEIDHHEPVEQVADWALRQPAAASTTEVIYDWLKVNHLPISQPLAEAILVGLVVDTGNFLYSATSEKNLAIAAEMLKRGANWPKIIKTAAGGADLATAKLWGLALERLKINHRYQVAFTVLTRADLANCQADDEAAEGLAGFLSRLKDVKAVLVLKETGDGVIKGSWRACQTGVNVAKLCSFLGGGGHVKAAGFHFNGRLVKDGAGWKVV